MQQTGIKETQNNTPKVICYLRSSIYAGEQTKVLTTVTIHVLLGFKLLGHRNW